MNDQKPDYLRNQYYSPHRSPIKPEEPDNEPKQNPKKRKTHRFRKLIVSLVLIIVVVFIALAVTNKHGNISNEAKGIVKKVQSKSKLTPKADVSSSSIATMGSSINSIIAGDPGVQISVNLIDLQNNQAEHYGSTSSNFQDASTAKIITAEYFLHEVEVGKQSLTETVGGYTAKYELQQMIVVSDDTAWANLNNLLGYNNLQNYADSTFGISDYQAYNNSSDSDDIALALQYLWEGKVVNASDKALLLSYLKQANYRTYIVPAIPADDTIYHKIGLYEDYVNDAAIVTNGSKAFDIVIFTDGNGTYDWTARASMMQSVTKAALKAYFNQ